MKLVCIPAYNAEKKIGDVVKKSLEYVDEVIVCDDGSTDNTAKIASESGAHVLSHKKNQGYGAALITMFEQARKDDADVMITLDGDGQHDPAEIPLFLKSLEEKNVDVVIGSRFLNNKKKPPAYRTTGIKVITSAIRLGDKLKITDAQCGFRAYSKKAIEVIHPTETGMAASTEILHKISNKDLTIFEVPIEVSYDGQLVDLYHYSITANPDGFARMLTLDAASFERKNYTVSFVRREFLGEIRTFVFDVIPKTVKGGKPGRFSGRIWVEDHDYHIVRYNGVYGSIFRTNLHFDSWRVNVEPGVWLPAYVYTEEPDRPGGDPKIKHMGQTRIWGYDVGNQPFDQEFAKVGSRGTPGGGSGLTAALRRATPKRRL